MTARREEQPAFSLKEGYEIYIPDTEHFHAYKPALARLRWRSHTCGFHSDKFAGANFADIHSASADTDPQGA
jgi:hypothetical protein